MALGEGSPDWLTPGRLTIYADGSTYFHELAAETVEADQWIVEADQWIQDIPVPRDGRQLEWDGESYHDIPAAEGFVHHKVSPWCSCRPRPDMEAGGSLVWHHYTEEEQE